VHFILLLFQAAIVCRDAHSVCVCAHSVTQTDTPSRMHTHTQTRGDVQFL